MAVKIPPAAARVTSAIREVSASDPSGSGKGVAGTTGSSAESRSASRGGIPSCLAASFSAAVSGGGSGLSGLNAAERLAAQANQFRKTFSKLFRTWPDPGATRSRAFTQGGSPGLSGGGEVLSLWVAMGGGLVLVVPTARI